MAKKKSVRRHIKHTSHPGHGTEPTPIRWGARDAMKRGPVIGTLSDPDKRNVIGTHSGSYSVYRALAVAARVLDPHPDPIEPQTVGDTGERWRVGGELRHAGGPSVTSHTA